MFRVCFRLDKRRSRRLSPFYQEHAVGRLPAIARRSSLRKIRLIHPIPDARYIRFRMAAGERYISIGIDTREYARVHA